MGKDTNASKPSAGRDRVKYRYVSQVQEDNSSDPQSTFAVQFCWRPSKYHIQGGGACWPTRGPLLLGPNNTAEPVKISPPTKDPEQDMDLGDDDLVIVSETKTERKWRDLFATCNGLTVRIYEARKGMKPILLQVYEDEDPEEQYYCVGWTYNVEGKHEWWVCAAGRKGILRVMNVQKAESKMALPGHGEAINDLKVHPRDPALVMTASKDESLRLWNLRTGSTIAVFAGLKGHRGEVVHLDFDACGKRIVSCGIDNSVRIWEISDNEKVLEAILDSHDAADLGVKDTYVYKDKTGTRKKTRVPICQFPYFVTRKVHKHYVDCVMWMGDMLLSKSVHNRMFLWAPGNDRESLSSPASSYKLLVEHMLQVCDVWFVRFGMDRPRRLVACGNGKGVVSIFDLSKMSSEAICEVRPRDKEKSRDSGLSFVRQCAFSEDGSILLAVNDSAQVVQYERSPFSGHERHVSIFEPFGSKSALDRTPCHEGHRLFLDKIMPVANDAPLESLSVKESGYRFSSSIVEERSSAESYGVQFCLKPSEHHLRGGGTTWQCQNCSEKSNGRHQISVPYPLAHSHQNGTADSDEDDCEITPVPSPNQNVSWRDIFVTCTGIYVRVYEAKKKKMPTLLQTYLDQDPDEMFYCVATTYNADGNREWWVCAAGNRGVLRVINMQTARLTRSLTGHGEAINDIKIHPRDPALALTASRDESLRLWNLRSGVTVAIFAGLKGHRGQVLFADFDTTGRRFVSCGIDNSIRIWDVDADHKLVEAIVESHVAADCGADDTYVYEDRHGNKRKMQPRTCQFPYFVATKVHNHYVDCVMWVGDLLLSKSVHDRMLLWEPGFDRESLGAPTNNFTLLEEYTIEGCGVWFIRFGMDQRRRLVACGNDEGVIIIYDLATIPSEPLCEVSPRGGKVKRGKIPSRLVRQCAFSEGGHFLVAVDEHSSIMQYERK